MKNLFNLLLKMIFQWGVLHVCSYFFFSIFLLFSFFFLGEEVGAMFVEDVTPYEVNKNTSLGVVFSPLLRFFSFLDDEASSLECQSLCNGCYRRPSWL